MHTLLSAEDLSLNPTPTALLRLGCPVLKRSLGPFSGVSSSAQVFDKKKSACGGPKILGLRPSLLVVRIHEDFDIAENAILGVEAGRTCSCGASQLRSQNELVHQLRPKTMSKDFFSYEIRSFHYCPRGCFDI